MNIDTGLGHCSKWKTTIHFRVCVLLDSRGFVDVHVYFVSLTAPVTWASDHRSDDHVIVIRCGSRSLTNVVGAVSLTK